MFWLWGGTGSCGLKFTATGLTLDGAESGYTFSALYLNFNTYFIVMETGAIQIQHPISK